MKNKFRINEKAFIRNRKLPFTQVVVFMMGLLKKSMRIELTNFFERIGKGALNAISNSAFCQARMKIKPDLFRYLLDKLNSEFYTDNDERVKLWHGFRLLGCDGSTMILPATQELKAIYGICKNQHATELAMGRCSVLYDLENEMVIDGVLVANEIGERELVFQHIDKIKNSGYKELIIFDRGYPSFDLMYNLLKSEIDFIMRVKINYNNVTQNFYCSPSMDTEVEINVGKNIVISKKEYTRKDTILLRLVKVLLSSGETEILITSLRDNQQFPTFVFKQLYFKRWGIETFYDKLKNKIRIEDFSGYSDTCVQQDYYCSLLMSNLQSLLCSEANDEIKSNSGNGKKYEYKVNVNLSLGFIKNRLVDILLNSQPAEKTLDQIKSLFIKNKIPIRPGRSLPRNTEKLRKSRKSGFEKNFKYAL